MDSLLKFAVRLKDSNRRKKWAKQNRPGYNYRQQSINKLSEQLMYIHGHDIKSRGELAQRYTDIKIQMSKTRESLIIAESKFKELQELAKYINTCSRYAPEYEQYKRLRGTAQKSYENTHPGVGLYAVAVKKLRENNITEQKQLANILQLYHESGVTIEALKTEYEGIRKEIELIEQVNTTLGIFSPGEKGEAARLYQKEVEISK